MLLALLYDARAAVVVEGLQGYTHVHVAACVSGETHVTSKLDAAAGRCTREGDMKRRSGCCMRAAASISTTWLDLNITLLLDHSLIHAYTHSGAAP